MEFGAQIKLEWKVSALNKNESNKSQRTTLWRTKNFTYRVINMHKFGQILKIYSDWF